MKTIKVSDKGQIAIPQLIRKNLEIQQGDELVLIQVGNKILIEKMQRAEKKLQEDFKDLLRFSESSLKKIWDNKEDDIWEEYLKNK